MGQAIGFLGVKPLFEKRHPLLKSGWVRWAIGAQIEAEPDVVPQPFRKPRRRSIKLLFNRAVVRGCEAVLLDLKAERNGYLCAGKAEVQ